MSPATTIYQDNTSAATRTATASGATATTASGSNNKSSSWNPNRNHHPSKKNKFSFSNNNRNSSNNSTTTITSSSISSRSNITTPFSGFNPLLRISRSTTSHNSSNMNATKTEDYDQRRPIVGFENSSTTTTGRADAPMVVVDGHRYRPRHHPHHHRYDATAARMPEAVAAPFLSTTGTAATTTRNARHTGTTNNNSNNNMMMTINRHSVIHHDNNNNNNNNNNNHHHHHHQLSLPRTALSVSADDTNFPPPGSLVLGGGGGGMTSSSSSNNNASANKEGSSRNHCNKIMGLYQLPTKFELQRLPVTLDRACAPSIPTPMAPFAGKNERKRALLNASYYSECFLNAIPPVTADIAAIDAQKRYEKWWVKSKHHHHSNSNTSNPNPNPNNTSSTANSNYDKSEKRPLLSSTAMMVSDTNHTGTIVPSRTTDASRKRPRISPLEEERPTNNSTSNVVAISSPSTMNTATTTCNNSYYVTSEDESGRSSSTRTVTTTTTTTTLQQEQQEPHHETHHPNIEGDLILTKQYETSMMMTVKNTLLSDLKHSGGDTSSMKFLSCLESLNAYYLSTGQDARWGLKSISQQQQQQQSCFLDNSDSSMIPLDGTWLTLSKPTYTECLGHNKDGEYMYTLGRMSFDMFRPTNLRCSIQGIFNLVCVADEMREDADYATDSTTAAASTSSTPTGSRRHGTTTSSSSTIGGQQHPATSSLPSNHQHHRSRRPRSFPKRLQKGYGSDGTPPVRNYDIVVAFTIDANQTRRGMQVEPNPQQTGNDLSSPINNNDSSAASGTTANENEYVVRKPIKALLTNHGYCVPDPKVPNRLSIWFSGGALELQNEQGQVMTTNVGVDDEDDTDDDEITTDNNASTLQEWKELFDASKVPPRDLREYARVLAARFLLGAQTSETMDEDGVLNYKLNRPIGGHGQVFCDILYQDTNLRIVRGHHGSVYVFSKVPIGNDATTTSTTMDSNDRVS